VPRVLVLYHPDQYRLARALLARYETSELWYVRPELNELSALAPARAEELREFDELARQRATAERTLAPELDSARAGSTLRLHLQELGIISPHPFLPGARSGRVSR
jgi:hypothetical protein